MRTGLVIAALLSLWASHAQADSTTAPWAVGVSDQQKSTADARLAAGNALFLERKFTEALATYREALAAWDHPAIRFNIVRCLIQLERPTEAAENLEAALRYGPAALEDEVYTEALAYQKLLATQVARLELSCTQRGVAISVDGQPAGTCPLQLTRRLPPGTHQVLGTGPGLVPRALDITLVGGQSTRATLRLDKAATGPSARTYGTIAVYSGLGLLAVSGGLGLYAWRSYRGQFPEHCIERDGAAPLCDASGSQVVDRALRIGDVSTITAGVGAIALAAGAIVLWRFPRRDTRITPTSTGLGLSLTRAF